MSTLVTNYRADIDGLRAIAVIPVLLFHSGISLFSGGFVGVDVFFVISGYLITSMLVQEIREGTFSIVSFYERRIRRIFPALFVVIGFSSIVSFFVLMPSDFKEFGKSVVAASLFASNMLFLRSLDYFAAPAELAPLLHTWSLAVEEQFYISFPIFLFLVFRFFHARWIMSIVPIFILSFAASIWGVSNYPAAAFYLAPTRAWELMLGSLLAVGAFPSTSNQLFRESFSIVGFGLIVWSVITLSPDLSFPGWHALFPCVGAGLIIYSGIGGRSIVGRVLEKKPLVFLGLISYSLYLWNWVLIAAARYYLVRELSGAETAVLLVTSLVIATVSWHFIEKPFRRRDGAMTRRVVFLSACGAVSVATALGMFVYANDGLPQRFPVQLQAILERHYEDGFFSPKCYKTPAEIAEGNVCGLGDKAAGTRSFLLWGDSHATSLAHAIDLQAKKYGVAGSLVYYRGCPPLLGITLFDSPSTFQCKETNDAVLPMLARTHIMTVIMHARWGFAVNGTFPLDNWGRRGVYSLEGRLFKQDAISAALDRTLQLLTNKGIKVYLVAEIPEIEFDVPNMVGRRKSFDRAVDIRPTLEGFKRRQKNALEMLEYYARKYRVEIIYPHEALCDKGKCEVEIDGVPLYMDNNHLSEFGAASISHIFEPIFSDHFPSHVSDRATPAPL